MKTRVILTTVVSFVLLLAVILAGLNAIFTVTDIQPVFSTFSEDGDREGRELQEKLADRFVNASTVFLDLEDVRGVVEEYPCFRIEEAEKSYPNGIRLKITERREAFAYLLKSGVYAILDEEGEYLYDKEENVNRMSGENILLTGFDFRIEDGEVTGEYAEELVNIFGVLRETLSQVRANVLSIALVPTTTGRYYIRIEMREGVAVELENPNESAADMTRIAMDWYVNQAVETELVRGKLTVYAISGELRKDYSA